MQRSGLIWSCGCLALLFSLSLSHFSAEVVGQSQSGSNNVLKSKSSTGNSMVSLTSSITVPISNETLKIENGMLVSAVFSYLGSGPNVLKTLANDQTAVTTKITNKINNDTQLVEGAEATNAIIGVEIGKALKSIISSPNKPNQTGTVTVETSSNCKPAMGSISCENSVTIH